MAQIKISELTNLTNIADDDLLAGVDTSSSTTVNMSASSLKNYINKEQDIDISNLKTTVNNHDTTLNDITPKVEKHETNIARNTTSIKRLENNIFESGEAEGSIINIKDSVLSEAKKVEVDGVTDQETTTGKNEFNLQEHNLNSNNVIVTEVGDNNLKIEVTANTTWAFTQYTIRNLEKNTDYKLLFDFKNSNSTLTTGYILIKGMVSGENVFNDNANGKVEFNTGEETDFYFRFGATRGTATTNTAEYSNIMLCLASETDDYEKYTGKMASPNSDYPAPMSVIRDNFKIGSHAKNYYNCRNSIRQYDYAVVDEEDWITLSGDNTNGTATAYYDYPTFISKSLKPNIKYKTIVEVKEFNGDFSLFPVSVGSNNGQFAYTWELKSETISSNYVYEKTLTTNDFSTSKSMLRSFLGISSGKSGSVTFRISVLEDTSITADTFVYEPYIESTIDVVLPEGEFIAEGDMLSVEYNEEDGENHLYLDKKIGYKLFDSTHHWVADDTPKVEWKSFYSTNAITDAKSSGKIVSNRAGYYTTAEILSNDISAISITSGGYIRLKLNGNITDNASLKAYLGANETYAFYEIANPYRIDLGAVSQLKTYSDETNVFTDSELQPNIYMLYNRNFKTTVRNLQVNEGKLQEELASMQTKISNLESAISSIQTSLVNESEVVE